MSLDQFLFAPCVLTGEHSFELVAKGRFLHLHDPSRRQRHECRQGQVGFGKSRNRPVDVQLMIVFHFDLEDELGSVSVPDVCCVKLTCSFVPVQLLNMGVSYLATNEAHSSLCPCSTACSSSTASTSHGMLTSRCRPIKASHKRPFKNLLKRSSQPSHTGDHAGGIGVGRWTYT